MLNNKSKKKHLNFEQINEAALRSIKTILNHFLPGGKFQGDEYLVLNPKRTDLTLGSFTINLTSGKWADFATPNKGGDITSLIAFITDCSQYEAGHKLEKFLGLSTHDDLNCFSLKDNKPTNDSSQQIFPIPNDIPEPKVKHHRLGEPSKTWVYHDQSGNRWFYIYRFETERDKVFRPLTYSFDDNKITWLWKAPPSPWPLYNLPLLVKYPNATVIISEGEKASDACSKLFPIPNFVVTTTPFGSNSASKADLTPLKDRHVILWPDNDEAGKNYLEMLAKKLSKIGVKSLKIIPLERFAKLDNDAGGISREALPEKWDAADALNEDWSYEQIESDILPYLQDFQIDNLSQNAHEESQLNSQTTRILALCKDIELFHCPNKKGFARVQVQNHKEVYPIRSRDFELFLNFIFYKHEGISLRSNALSEAQATLEARALYDCEERNVYLRVASVHGKIYIALCNKECQYIEIDSDCRCGSKAA